MERDGEHRPHLAAQPLDLRHHARRGDRDPPLAEAEAVAIGQDLDGFRHRIEGIERLAHAHEDDVCDEPVAFRGQAGADRAVTAGIVAQPVARHQHLRDDLGGGEVAHEALRARVAEGTVERAAHLAGDAERAAVALRDIDALHLVRLLAGGVGGQAQQPFAGAVLRDLLHHDLRPRQRIMLRETGAQMLGDVGHLVERGGPAQIDPVPELVHAHAQFPLGDARGGQRHAELLPVQPGEAGQKRATGHGGHGFGGHVDQARHLGTHKAFPRPLPLARGGGRRISPLGRVSDAANAARCGQKPYLHSCATRSSAWPRPLSE